MKYFIEYVSVNIRNWLSILFAILFTIALIFVMSGDRRSLETYQSVLEKNKLRIEGLSLLYIMDNKTYVNIFSEEAYVDIINKSIELTDLKFEYNSNNTKVKAEADKGSYEMERYIYAYGKIKGEMGGMNFISGDDGILKYDYKEGLGEVKNGVKLSQGKNIISADYALFNSKSSFVLFSNRVVVEYFMR